MNSYLRESGENLGKEQSLTNLSLAYASSPDFIARFH